MFLCVRYAQPQPQPKLGEAFDTQAFGIEAMGVVKGMESEREAAGGRWFLNC